MTIHFKKGEYDLYLNDESVGITLDTIKKKILSRNFQQFANIAQRIATQREELEQAGLDMVAVEWWLTLHSRRYKAGYLIPAKGLMLLKAFAELLQNADVDAINRALQKVVAMNNPEKATIAYVKAIINTPLHPPQGGNNAGETPALPGGKNTGGGDCVRRQPEAVWNIMMARLKRRIPIRNFNTWLQSMQFLSYLEGNLRISVPDHTYVYWINTYYIRAIREEWRAAGGAACRIEITA